MQKTLKKLTVVMCVCALALLFNAGIVKADETVSETEGTTVSQETTTQPEITTQPETIAPETTTEKPTTASIAWTKNSNGKFVNDKGKEISGATMKGMDISYHQGTINWAEVASTDIDYAIIRCGYGDNILSQDDKEWKTNAAACEKYNIPYGVYIYSYATTVKQAQSEADHVLRLINGHTINFPIYYDMEDKVQSSLTSAKRGEIANAFLNKISAAGYECGIYASLNWWDNKFPGDLVKNTLWYKWIAQWNSECTYKSSYQMWQFTSDGAVSGISGRVDLNLWFGPVRTRSYDIRSKGNVVVKAPLTVKAPKKVTIKSVKKGKKKATIKWKKVTGAKGYKVQYSTSKKFKAKYTKSKFTKKTSLVVKKLKSRKTYYIRIKAYKVKSNGKKIYSAKWSKVKRVKIK